MNRTPVAAPEQGWFRLLPEQNALVSTKIGCHELLSSATEALMVLRER